MPCLTGDWKVPGTRRQECLRYVAQLRDDKALSNSLRLINNSRMSRRIRPHQQGSINSSAPRRAGSGQTLRREDSSIAPASGARFTIAGIESLIQN
jgi:hypothetical protein